MIVPVFEMLRVLGSCLHLDGLTMVGGARLTSAGRGGRAAVEHLGGRVGRAAVRLRVAKLDVAADGVRHHRRDGSGGGLKAHAGGRALETLDTSIE